MRIQTLELLRCPFCGSRVTLVENRALARTDTTIDSGVLSCECCAFPIVAGIPVMMAAPIVQSAVHQIEAGEHDVALFTLLGLGDDRRRVEDFEAFLERGDAVTYRDAIGVLSPDAEGHYFVYRLSDPTFLLARAVLDALTRHPRVQTGKILDLCGGSGHLTRVLADRTSPDQTLLADLYFWKLWLAQRFTAPGCDAICCDGNHPLPFPRDAFSLVVCSDAFPFVWHRRLMAEEMMRLAGSEGVVVLPHLHSALGENFTAGMMLTPRAYQDLFAPLGARLFKDSALLAQVLDGRALDLEVDAPLTAFEGEPSLTLIATRRTDVFRAYDPQETPNTFTGTLTVNPLYRVERRDGVSVLTLSFPTAEYEAEFGECKRYLPATVIVPADLTKPFHPSALGADYAELRRRHVIVDAPLNYC